MPKAGKTRTFAKGFKDLNDHIAKDLIGHKGLTRDKAFAYWFCQCACIHPDDNTRIMESLTGISSDRNLDILAWDEIAETVFLCQTKYRDHLNKKNEEYNDVIGFASLGSKLASKDEADFIRAIKNATNSVKTRAREALKYVKNRKSYKIKLFYVTTGKVSKAIIEDALNEIRPYKDRVDFKVYDGTQVCRLFREFQSLVPAIHQVEIPDVERVVMPTNPYKNSKCFVFPASIANIHSLIRKHEDRLFARNIRLNKGERGNNSEIWKTLNSANKRNQFFYMNNGITFLGSNIEHDEENRLIRISDPQIINGQQTTRTIGRFEISDIPNEEVLIKAISNEPRSDYDYEIHRSFVNDVVKSTNSQTKISFSELAANNPEQITIQMALKNCNWKYVRKTGSESNPFKGTDFYGSIKLTELATALMVCTRDPQYIKRKGIEKLFEPDQDHLYKTIFSNKATKSEILLCYLIWRLCQIKSSRKRRKGSRTKTGESLETKVLKNLAQYYISFIIYLLLKESFNKDISFEKRILQGLSAEIKQRKFNESFIEIRDIIFSAWKAYYKQNQTNPDVESDPNKFCIAIASADNWKTFWNSKCRQEQKDVKRLLLNEQYILPKTKRRISN
jgi:hypothetical protein